MGAFVTVLVERPGLYLLAGGGAMVMKGRHGFTQKQEFSTKIRLWTRGKMADCEHECCGAAEKVWLPYEFEGRSRGLKPHSYCILCGVVKNMSSKSKSKKAKRMGDYTNILSRLGITNLEVQIRLIAKELERIQDFDFSNVNYMTRNQQEKLFIRAVKKYSRVPEDTIRAFL